MTSHGSRSRGEHVVGVQVLVERAPARPASAGASRERVERRVEQPALARPPGRLPLALERRRPTTRPRRRAAGTARRRLPEPRQQADQHVERRLGPARRGRPRLAALEQQRVPLVVAREQPHRAVAVPGRERLRLVLALAVPETAASARPASRPTVTDRRATRRPGNGARARDAARHARTPPRSSTARRRASRAPRARPRASLRPGGPAVRARLPVRERRQLLPDLPQPRAVEVGDDHGLLVRRLREHDPPRVGDQRAAVARPPRPRLADLGRRRDEDLVLDRPRPQQHVPVILARVEREVRRHGDELGALEREDAVELRESGGRSRRSARAASPRRVGHDGLVAGLLGVGLAVRRGRRPRRRTGGSCGRRPPATPSRVEDEHVFDSFSRPSRRSVIEPPTSVIAVPRAHPPSPPPTRRPRAAPPAACSRRGVPIPFHFSGRTTRSAPAAAASRDERSARSRFAALSGPLESWTQATRRRVGHSERRG